MGRLSFAILGTLVMVSTCVSQEQYDVRLSRSANLREGYVEVFYNGEWGTVCRDGWDFLDAFVVCRQLGFSWVSYRGWEEDFGPGSGPAWLSNVACEGSERSLADCPNDGWMDHSCSSASAAAVSCGFIDGYSEAKAYLGDGLPYSTYAMSEGNAYLKFSAESYYALTDYGWSDLNANIFCRQRSKSVGGGYAATASTQGSYFGRHHDKLKPVDGNILPVSVLPVNFSCQGSENFITDCPAEALPNDSEAALRGHNAGVICAIREVPPDFSIRLVDGDYVCQRLPCQGVVEVSHGGSWGSIQYVLGSEIPGYDTNLADVVCRQLGNGYPTVVSRDGRFGKSSTNVKMIINACSGAESSLAECGPDLQFVDQVGEGYNLSIACNDPNVSGSRLLRLYSNQLEISSWPDGAFENVNGTLQVFHKGRFGTICNDGWTIENSNTICVLLGYGKAVSTLSDVQHKVGGPMYLDNVTCVGDEWSFSQCSHGGWLNTNCDHGGNVEIACYGREVSEYFTPSVFVYFMDNRGSVCKDGFDNMDAVVVCKQYRYPFAQTWSYTSRNRDIPVWVSDVQCTGHENELFYCPNDGWREHTSCDQTVVEAFCKDEEGYVDMEAFIVDGLGDSAVMTDGTAMLRLKTGEVMGICDEEWDLDDATVFCRQIGKYSAEAATTGSHFGQHYGNSSPLDGKRTLNVRYWCTGIELSLKICPAGFYCENPRFNAGVKCLYREEPEGFKIRLVNKTLEQKGRVEVFYDGSWGSVGNDVNMTDPIRYGDVICRQLDLGYAVGVSVNSGESGVASLPVKMTDVWCAGSENSLAQCGPNLKWVDTPNNFLEGDSSEIECSGEISESAHPLRLSPESTHEREGYLEIFKDKRFATICSEHWSPENTEVACRELGFGPPESVTSKQGAHGGPIFWSNYYCIGNESRLDTCTIDGNVQFRDCGHERDVYIKCAKKECTEVKPCFNGGICNLNKCECKEGFSGERCQNASSGVINHAGLVTVLANILVAMLGTVIAS